MKMGVGPPSSVTDEEAEFELALAAEELPKDDPRLLSLLPPWAGPHGAPPICEGVALTWK